MKEQDVIELIKGDERFSVLTKILETSGLARALSRERNVFTFFAPTDRAFSSVPKAAMRLMLSRRGRDLTATVVGRHIVPGEYLYSSDLRCKSAVRPLHGSEIKISNEKNILRFGGATIGTPGMAVKNGVVFPVDRVLAISRRRILNA